MLVGMGKSNRSLELDALGKSLIPVTVAHSRNKLVIPHPKAEKLFRGKDTSIPRLLQAMKKGVSRGRRLLQEHCNFKGEAFQTSSDGAESDEAETDDEEEEVEDIDSSEEWAKIVTVYGDSLHHDTAVEENGNRDREGEKKGFIPLVPVAVRVGVIMRMELVDNKTDLLFTGSGPAPTGIPGLDYFIGALLVVFSLVIISGNALVIQVIRYQTRKSVCDFIFAQISFVHIFGGFSSFISAFILLSGRTMFDYRQVDNIVCWLGGVVWHLVVLLTPMFLCLVVTGRFIIHFAPLRYESIVNMTYVVSGSSLSWAWSSAVLAPFIVRGFNIGVEESWAYPHFKIPPSGVERYLMIGCFAGPLLLLELILIILILSILVDFKVFTKKKKKQPKSFIQAGLRKMLAQTMVPLPTVFEGSEQEPVQSAGLNQASFFTTNTATRSQTSYHDLEHNKEIFRWMEDSARVIATSTHNIFQSRSDSCLSWSAVSTPVSIRAGQSAQKLHCGSFQSSTHSLSHIRSEIRSVFDSMVSRISSPGRVTTELGGTGARSRNKEQQTKIVALHLSYSFLLTHFMVSVYTVSCLTDPQLGPFDQSRRDGSQLQVYLKGCYYAAVFINSGMTPVVYWTFHQKYRQRVSFYFYRLKIILVKIRNRLCSCC
ncbi:uncharacterized protein LOC134816877 [Bolinopsis microptera]|uniref:uncharacterized protein LOC134816877 n=1 Tax=Bolinopsis microptera TaxID=2820187 RepID=UPI00307A5157